MRITRVILASIATLFGIGTSAAAQRCRPPEHPYFDFQVQRAAEFIPDSTHRVHPATGRAASENGPLVVVQFVVDTLGVPDSTSFHVIINNDATLAEAARLAYRRWRYRPAIIDSCRVPQLVQAAAQR